MCRCGARESGTSAQEKAGQLEASALESRRAAEREDAQAERLTEEGNLDAASRAASAAADHRSTAQALEKEMAQAWGQFEAASGQGGTNPYRQSIHCRSRVYVLAPHACACDIECIHSMHDIRRIRRIRRYVEYIHAEICKEWRSTSHGEACMHA